jgi:hypothetical protein
MTNLCAGPQAYSAAYSGVHFEAHHALLLAIPAFLPAVIVVGVVLYAAMRDRRGNKASTEVGENTDEKQD